MIGRAGHAGARLSSFVKKPSLHPPIFSTRRKKPMKRLSLAVSALLGLAALLPAHARPPVAISHPAPGQRIVFDRRKFMPVSELRPGMRGYALTVFKGTKIEKFGVEILGVMSKFNEGKDYILFQATDGPPITRHLNIAHGMSGSPIYIGGRLVGAISMEVPSSTNQGPSFPREPIGLATPIEEMLDAWSPDLPKHPDLGRDTGIGQHGYPGARDKRAQLQLFADRPAHDSQRHAARQYRPPAGRACARIISR